MSSQDNAHWAVNIFAWKWLYRAINSYFNVRLFDFSMTKYLWKLLSFYGNSIKPNYYTWLLSCNVIMIFSFYSFQNLDKRFIIVKNAENWLNLKFSKIMTRNVFQNNHRKQKKNAKVQRQRRKSLNTLLKKRIKTKLILM